MILWLKTWNASLKDCKVKKSGHEDNVNKENYYIFASEY